MYPVLFGRRNLPACLLLLSTSSLIFPNLAMRQTSGVQLLGGQEKPRITPSLSEEGDDAITSIEERPISLGIEAELGGRVLVVGAKIKSKGVVVAEQVGGARYLVIAVEHAAIEAFFSKPDGTLARYDQLKQERAELEVLAAHGVPDSRTGTHRVLVRHFRAIEKHLQLLKRYIEAGGTQQIRKAVKAPSKDDVEGWETSLSLIESQDKTGQGDDFFRNDFTPQMILDEPAYKKLMTIRSNIDKSLELYVRTKNAFELEIINEAPIKSTRRAFAVRRATEILIRELAKEKVRTFEMAIDDYNAALARADMNLKEYELELSSSTMRSKFDLFSDAGGRLTASSQINYEVPLARLVDCRFLGLFRQGKNILARRAIWNFARTLVGLEVAKINDQQRGALMQFMLQSLFALQAKSSATAKTKEMYVQMFRGDVWTTFEKLCDVDSDAAEVFSNDKVKAAVVAAVVENSPSKVKTLSGKWGSGKVSSVNAQVAGWYDETIKGKQSRVLGVTADTQSKVEAKIVNSNIIVLVVESRPTRSAFNQMFSPGPEHRNVLNSAHGLPGNDFISSLKRLAEFQDASKENRVPRITDKTIDESSCEAER